MADDAVAEAFAQALRRRSEIREPGRWVWRAAFRIARGELKRRSRSTALSASVTTLARSTSRIGGRKDRFMNVQTRTSACRCRLPSGMMA